MTGYLGRALAYALGFLVMWGAEFWFCLGVHELNRPEWSANLGLRPPYVNTWVGFAAAGVIFLALFLVPALLHRQRGRAIPWYLAFFFSVGVFTLGSVIVAIAQMGWNVVMILQGVVFGIVVGVAAGMHVHKINFSFVKRQDISETVKIAVIDKVRDRWFKYFHYITISGLALLASTSIGAIYQAPAEIQEVMLAPLIVLSSYLTVLILAFCSWPALRNTMQAEEMILSIHEE